MINEESLLESIKEHPERFGVLFDIYYKKIFGYVFRRVVDYDISKDIAAETFLKAYLNINNFRWKNISISSWLYRIATNEINNYFRSKKYKPDSLNQLMEDYNFNLADESDSEKEILEKETEVYQNFLKVQNILKELPVKYQEVISLRYFERKSLNEISEILYKKEGTVKSLLSRGLNKIREKI